MSPRFTLERVGFGLRKAIVKSTLFKISGASLTLAPGVGRLVQFLGSKLKPRWDVHLAGSFAGKLQPWIAGLSGSAVSPRLCGG